MIISQSYGFSSGHVWIWELDYKESWVLKNWCFWPIVLEKTLRVLGTAKRSKQSILKEINPEYSSEGLMLKPPDAKSQLIRKDPDAGKGWRQKEKRATEDENVGWHHWLNGFELGQTPGDGEGQGSLVCCSSWVTKSRTWLSGWKTTEQCEAHNRKLADFLLD